MVENICWSWSLNVEKVWGTVLLPPKFKKDCCIWKIIRKKRKNPWYPLDRKLGWPRSQSVHLEREKNIWPLFGIEP
jgi:hypothetical protein